jgi:hypothetical protein
MIGLVFAAHVAQPKTVARPKTITVTVRINRWDILWGTPSATDCPGQRAIKRKVLRDAYVSASQQRILIQTMDGLQTVLECPPTLRAFMNEFDASASRGSVKPIEFTLDLPSEICA